MGSEANSKIVQAGSKSDLSPVRKLAGCSVLITKCGTEFCTFTCNNSSYSKYPTLFLPNRRATYCSTRTNMADYPMRPSVYAVCKPESNVPL